MSGVRQDGAEFSVLVDRNVREDHLAGLAVDTEVAGLPIRAVTAGVGVLDVAEHLLVEVTDRPVVLTEHRSDPALAVMY